MSDTTGHLGSTTGADPTHPPDDDAAPPQGPYPPAEPGLDVVLGPATRLLWRGPDTVHLELGRRAVVVEGLTPDTIARIAGTSPGRPVAPVRAEPDDRTAGHALGALREAGYLWPRPESRWADRGAVGRDSLLGDVSRSHQAYRRGQDLDDDPRRPPVPRLAGELAALATRHGAGAGEVLDARRFASVQVHGTGRVAVHLAAVLAASGVGRVHCVGAAPVRLADTAPGGLTPSDEGTDRQAAAELAVARAAPETDTSALPTDERPDLTVLALDAPLPPERRDGLHSSGAPYLAVTLGVDNGVIGPLVVPGLSSCLRCADLVRADRDPAWNALAVQLATPPRYGHPSGSTALATLVAGVAALQALAFLDGEDPVTLDGTLEIDLPDWRLRRRSWGVHPECGCASGEANGPRGTMSL